MPGPVWLYVGTAVFVLVVFWLAGAAGRREARFQLERRRLEAADERRVAAKLNGRPPLEARATQRYPPRPPSR